MEIYCVVTLVGLICKDISLAIVQFQGKLCPFVSKIFNSNGPDPARVGDVTTPQHMLPYTLLYFLLY